MIKQDYNFDKKVNQLKEGAFKSLIYRPQNVRQYQCCPFCGGKHFIKFGKYQGIQRYRCKTCKKTFSSTTCSMWKYVKKKPEKWIKFISLLCEGRTLRECAYILKITVSTVFYWRHKILHAVENYYKPEKFVKTVVVQKHSLPKCYKGSRHKHFMPQIKFKRKQDRPYCAISRDIEVLLSYEKVFPQIDVKYEDNTLQDIFVSNVLSRTDKKCYVHLYKLNNFEIHKHTIKNNKKLKREIRKKYDFRICKNAAGFRYIKDNFEVSDDIENYVSRLYCWISRFQGIASKYISHYYSLYSLISSEKKFDRIKVFKNLLKNSVYVSSENLKNTHLENY